MVLDMTHCDTEFSYYCVECGSDMGPHNPRQLCGKWYCKTSYKKSVDILDLKEKVIEEIVNIEFDVSLPVKFD